MTDTIESLSADSAPELLTVLQAAQITNVSASTLRMWINTGQVPAFRSGRVIRITRKSLQEFLAQHTAYSQNAGVKS